MLNYALDTGVAAKSDRMLSLMMKYNFSVSIEHLKQAARLGDKSRLLLIIDYVDKVKYPISEYLLDYLKVFVPSFSDDLKLERKLIEILGPSMVRHIILLHWVMNFINEIRCPNLSRYCIDNALGKMLLCSFISECNPVLRSDERLVKALNTYFSDGNILPKFNLLTETYGTILEVVEDAVRQGRSQSLGFFGKKSLALSQRSQYSQRDLDDKSHQSKRNSKLYLYMKQLDQLLRKSEEALNDEEANTQQLLKPAPLARYSQDREYPHL
jgi:hypothetical protein